MTSQAADEPSDDEDQYNAEEGEEEEPKAEDPEVDGTEKEETKDSVVETPPSKKEPAETTEVVSKSSKPKEPVEQQTLPCPAASPSAPAVVERPAEILEKARRSSKYTTNWHGPPIKEIKRKHRKPGWKCFMW